MSSRTFITGSTPLAAPWTPLIGSLVALRFVRFRATPPPRFDSWAALFHALVMEFRSSSTFRRKQDTSSPRAFLPEFRKVGVAGCSLPVMISSAIWVASFSFPRARYSAFATTLSSKRSR